MRWLATQQIACRISILARENSRLSRMGPLAPESVPPAQKCPQSAALCDASSLSKNLTAVPIRGGDASNN
jgi:hypothetical protein